MYKMYVLLLYLPPTIYAETQRFLNISCYILFVYEYAINTFVVTFLCVLDANCRTKYVMFKVTVQQQ